MWKFVALFACVALPKLRYLFMRSYCPWTKRKQNWFQRCGYLMVRDFAAYWNDYEMHGFEEIDGDNCLLVGYHSRCTVDLVYILVNVQPNIIATYLMFKIPVMAFILTQFNIIPSGSDNKAEVGFVSALAGSKRPLLLLPGGVYEALKPLAQIGKIQWKSVPGFARIIHKEQDHLGSNTKVVPFYTKNCEKLLFRSDFIYETCGKLGSEMYSFFKKGHYYLMPIMLSCMFLSIGFKIVPRSVKLDTYFGNPVVLKPGESAEDFSARISGAAQELIDKVEALPERQNKYSREGLLEHLLFWGTGAYTVGQNFLLISFILLVIWLPVMAVLYIGSLLYIYF